MQPLRCLLRVSHHDEFNPFVDWFEFPAYSILNYQGRRARGTILRSRIAVRRLVGWVGGKALHESD
jgi:hypothetical protein